MAQPVMLKVYGNLWPASPQLKDRLSMLCTSCLPPESQIVELDVDLLRISFEGIFFPLKEVLDCIKPSLENNTRGKLDVLDLEAWTLQRHIFANGKITCRSAPLNNILDYSGH